MRFDMGDVPTWLGGMGTITAIGVAVFTYSRDSNRQSEERRREQAALVDGWITTRTWTTLPGQYSPNLGPAVSLEVSIVNGTRTAMRDVVVDVGAEGYGDFSSRPIDILEPTARDHPLERRFFFRANEGDLPIGFTDQSSLELLTLKLTFTDAAGSAWERSGSKLELAWAPDLSMRQLQRIQHRYERRMRRHER